MKNRLAESLKKLTAAGDTVQALEQKHKAALARGAEVGKIEAEIGTARAKISRS